MSICVALQDNQLQKCISMQNKRGHVRVEMWAIVPISLLLNNQSTIIQIHKTSGNIMSLIKYNKYASHIF